MKSIPNDSRNDFWNDPSNDPWDEFARQYYYLWLPPLCGGLFIWLLLPPILGSLNAKSALAKIETLSFSYKALDHQAVPCAGWFDAGVFVSYRNSATGKFKIGKLCRPMFSKDEWTWFPDPDHP